MAVSLGDILVSVKADTSQLVSGFNKAENAVSKATGNMTAAIKAVASAYIGLNAIDITKNFVKQVDAITNVENRLKLVTKSSDDLLKVQEKLFAISQESSQSYVSIVDIYGRMAKSSKDLKLTQDDLLKVTEAIAKASVVGGGEATSIQMALTQLGQAFSSDFKAVGQELGSIREQTPRIYEMLVEGSGYTREQFKKMAEDGKLSLMDMVNAILKEMPKVESEYAQFTKTVDQTNNIVQNSIGKTAKEFDKLTGATQLIKEVMISVSQSLDSLSPEQIESVAVAIKNISIALVGSYASIKLIQGAMSVYNGILQTSQESLKKFTAIEEARTKATLAAEKAVKARTLATEASVIAEEAGTKAALNKANKLEALAVASEKSAVRQASYVTGLEASVKGFSMASIAANTFRTALQTIPFMIIVTGITAIATALFDTSKKAELANKTISATQEELAKLTKNQLNFRLSALAEEYNNATIEFRKARIDAVGGDTEALAKMDDAKQKITQIGDTINLVKNTMASLDKQGSSTATGVQETSKKMSSALQSIINPAEEIREKYKKLREELTTSGQNTAENIAKLAEEEKKAIESIGKKEENEEAKRKRRELKDLKDRVKQQEEYYVAIEDYAKAWAVEEEKIRAESSSLTEKQIQEVLKKRKYAFEQEHGLNLSTDEWQTYFTEIGDMSTAWVLEQAKIYEQYKSLTKEQIDEIIKIREQEFKNTGKVAEFENAYKQTMLTQTEYAKQELDKQYEQYSTFIKDKTKLDEWYNKKSREYSDNALYGMQDGLKSYYEEASDRYKNMANFAKNSFSTLEDTLVEFAKTGKFAVSDMVNSIIADFARLAIRQSITAPLAGAFSGIMGSMFSGATASAHGNVFNSGMQAFATGGVFTNSVVARPTMFAYGDTFGGSGSLGVMGEAGAEAVMPLSRIGSDLGVKATPSNVVLNITNTSGQAISADQISSKMGTNAQGEMERVIDIVIKATSTNKNNFRNNMKGLLA